MPSLRLLKAFTRLAETRNFRAAADLLHITQPALSLQIKDLEEKLGVSLFERQSHAATLTRAGEALLPKAHHILAASDELQQSATHLGEPLTGRLRLGIIPTIAPYALPTLLKNTAKKYPSLQLQVVENTTDHLVAALRAGELDMALLSPSLHHADLHKQVLFTEPLLLAIPRGHKLATQKNITADDILAAPLLLLDEGHCLRDQTMALCRAPRLPAPSAFKAVSLRTLTALVSHGLGVTLLPAMAAAHELNRRDPVVVKPLSLRGANRAIGLVWRKKHPGAAEFSTLADFFASFMKRDTL